MACNNCERVDIDLVAGLEPWRQAKLIGQYQEGATVDLSKPSTSVSALIESGQCGKDPTIIAASMTPSMAASQFIWICADETLSHGIWAAISLVEIQQHDPVENDGISGAHGWTGNTFSYIGGTSAAFNRIFIGTNTHAVLLSAGYAIGGVRTTVISRRSLGIGTRSLGEIFAYGERSISLGCHDPHTKAAAGEPIKAGVTFQASGVSNAAGLFSLSFQVPTAAVFRDVDNPEKLRCGIQVLARPGVMPPPATLDGIGSVAVFQSATENHSYNMASLDGSPTADFIPRVDLAGGPFPYRPDLFSETTYSYRPYVPNPEPCRVFNGPHWHGVRSLAAGSPLAGNGRTNTLSVQLQTINRGTISQPILPSYVDFFDCSTLLDSQGSEGVGGFPGRDPSDGFNFNTAGGLRSDGDTAAVRNALAGRVFALQPFAGGDQLFPDHYWLSTPAGTEAFKYEARPGGELLGRPISDFPWAIKDAVFSVEHFAHVGAVLFDSGLVGDQAVQFPPGATAESVGMTLDEFDWWSTRMLDSITPGWKRRRRYRLGISVWFFVGLKVTVTSVNMSSGSAVFYGRIRFEVRPESFTPAEVDQLELGQAVTKNGASFAFG